MRCPAIALVEGTGSISSHENTYETEVNVTCNDGYEIAAQTTLVINCTATETWSHLPVSCERTLRLSTRVANESVPIQLAQCRFRGLAVSNAKI